MLGSFCIAIFQAFDTLCICEILIIVAHSVQQADHGLHISSSREMLFEGNIVKLNHDDVDRRIEKKFNLKQLCN